MHTLTLIMGIISLIITFSIYGYFIGRSVEKNNSEEEIRILRHVTEYIPWIEIPEGVTPILDSESHILVQYQDGGYDSGKASSFIWKNSKGNIRRPIRYYPKTGL